MNNTAKISYVVASLVFAAGVLHTHYFGALYPGIAVGGALASIILYFGLLRQPLSDVKVIAAFLSLGLAYRVYSYLFPASMMRFDPDAYAVRSQVIISNGGLSEIVEGFYHTAAVFSVSGAEVSIITGLPVDDAYVVFPMIVSVAAPLFVGVLVRQVTDDTFAIVGAVGAVTLSASLIQYSNGPIPITLAAVYFAAFVLILVHTSGLPSMRLSILLFLFVFAGSLTHKIAVLLMAGTLLFLYVYSILSVQKSADELRPPKSLLALTTLVLLVTQWSFLTTYFASAIALTTDIVKVFTSVEATGLTSPAAATRVAPPLSVEVLRVAHYLLPVAVGAVGGVILFKYHKHGRIRSLQSAALVSAGITLPGIITSAAPGFQRVYVYAAIPVAALIGVFIGKLSNRTVVRRGLGVCIVFLLVLNPLAAAATPDQPGTPREYLTAQEVSAKEFGNRQVPGIVYADLFYGDEAVDFPAAAAGSEVNQRQVPQPQWHPGLIDSGLKNGTLLSKGYETIAYRTKVDVYRLTGGWYRLNWNAQEALMQNYHSAYDNGGVVIFERLD